MSTWWKEGVRKRLFCLLCPIQQQSHVFPSPPFAFSVPIVAHLVVLKAPCQIQLQVSFEIANPVSACSEYPHPMCFLFLFEFCQELLVIHVGLLLPLLDFLLIRMDHSRAWRRWSWTPLLSRTVIP